jgi:CRISPR-associated protein Cas1
MYLEPNITLTTSLPRASNGPRRPNKLKEDAWSARCKYWLEQPTTPRPRRNKNHPDRQPLILSGHGMRLKIDHGTFLVQSGFTHFPQRQEEYRLFPGDWRLPSRIIVLDGSGSLTFDVLRWLAEMNIPLVQINWRGEVVQCVGGTGYAIDPKLAQAQLAARQDGRWLILSRRLVLEKIANSIDTLRVTFPKSVDTEATITNLEALARGMKHRPPSTMHDLHGIEGKAAVAYFAVWHAFPLRWKGTGRHAIPDDWRRIGRRTSMLSDGKHRRNRNATHPVNAMLNYGYAVLENNVRAQVVGAGLDPMIGYFHGQSRGSHGLVYDLMEPLRPVVDRGVLEFAQRQVFEPADFTLTGEGVCRLNPELARSVVAVACNALGGTTGMRISQSKLPKLLDVSSS